LSLALARKYRPATFDDLIGQEAVSQTLSLALEGDRLSHAYLFSGLRGSGKTSTARIFAKALLCEKGTTAHPCGTCTHCTMSSENRHMDIIEMDAASNRGIDDIKDLIEHTKYKPSSGRYKIFIIDEVHMLTNQAFNALLKTLEEPPSFVKFILATTDPLKLPATILSRTQHFRFKKIPQNLVRKHLEHILNLENIEFEPEALEILARTGAGSLRDSLTLLDQAIVYSKNFVDVATVTGMLGIIEPTLLEQLLDDIMHKDTTKILTFIKMASEYEAEMILDELTLHLKSLLLAQNAQFTPMIIERFFRVIAESKALLALGSDGEFVLTLALFKMMEALQIKEIDMMIRGLEKELQGIEVSESIATVATQKQMSASLAPQQNEIIKEAVVPTTVDKKSTSVEPMQEPMENHKVQSTSTPYEPVPQETFHEETIHEETVSQQETTPLAAQTPTQIPQKADPHQKTFDLLTQKIYDRNYELGACFERNITFERFEEGKLIWESAAEGAERKQLITHWGLINMFVKELFGFDTKIVNLPKEKSQTKSAEAKKKAPIVNTEQAIQSNTPLPQTQRTEVSPSTKSLETVSHQNANSASMIEDIEMKSSCIAPEAGETEAAKEKDPSSLLDEPMIKEAIALFDPKKVRIKKNT